MKIVLGDIEFRVDNVMGIKDGNAQIRLWNKYALIFKVSELLTVEQQFVKDYIKRQAGIALDNINTAKLIPVFSTELEMEFPQFTTMIVMVAKKNLHVNNAETSEFNNKMYESRKISDKEDSDHMAELRKVVDRLSKDEANKDMVIHNHPDILKLEEKARSCWSCGSINCLTM